MTSAGWSGWEVHQTREGSNKQGRVGQVDPDRPQLPASTPPQGEKRACAVLRSEHGRRSSGKDKCNQVWFQKRSPPAPCDAKISESKHATASANGAPWVRDAGGHGKNKEHTGTNGGVSRSGGRSTNYAQKMRSSGSGVESHAGGGCSMRAAWPRRTSCLPGSLGGVGRGATLRGSGFGPSAVVDLDILDHGALGCSS